MMPRARSLLLLATLLACRTALAAPLPGGDVSITSSTAWPEGEYNLTSLSVGGGATLSVAGGSTLNVAGAVSVTGSSTLLLRGKNTDAPVGGRWQGAGVTLTAVALHVEAGSKVSADEQGYLGGTASGAGAGPGGGGGVGYWDGAGAGYGGQGGTQGGAVRGAVYGSAASPTDLGSGGGASWDGAQGGAGGGAVRLVVSGTLTLDGTISANGAVGAGYNGGGSGGSIFATVDTLTGSGLFTADGGDRAGLSNAGGSGGGGRIAVYCRDADGFSGMGASTAKGGFYAADGTVAFVGTAGPSPALSVFRRFELGPDTVTEFGSITLSNGASLSVGGGSEIAVDGAVTLTGSSTLLLQGKNTAATVEGRWQGTGVTLRAADVRVDAGSKITADAQGYTGGIAQGGGSGPGGGGGVGWYDGAGAGYGGQGGTQGGAVRGGVYGSAERPVDLGSGGGAGWDGARGGAGGGAIRLLVSGTLTLNGTISADGAVGDGYNGGGSGGSILADVGTLTGAGAFTADGGDRAGLLNPGGSGGGGRVAVYYLDMAGFSGEALTTARGGQSAGDGTVLFTDVPRYAWPSPATDTLHDTVRVEWEALAVDLVTTRVDVSASSGGRTFSVAEGLPCIGAADWDTAAVPDGRYELRLSFLDGSGHLVKELVRDVLVNNSVVWHSGSVSGSQTWAADRVHVVEGTLTLLPGAHVVLEPGAVVKATRGSSVAVGDGAVLDALGTAEAGVVFTSLADDGAGGDTNLDGLLSRPSPGDWLGVNPSGTGQFNRNADTQVRYARLTRSGTLSADETWSGAYVYHVDDNLTVAGGVTLTIEPGTVVKLGTHKGITLQPGGRLVANGTLAQPITFTSLRDDSAGGDSNGDGNATSPAAGDWQWIYVDGAEATFDHVFLLYGGGNASGTWSQTGVVRTNGGATVSLRNSTLQDALYDGVLAWGGAVEVVSSVVTRTDRGVCAHPGSAVTVRNCTVDDNRVGLLLHGGSLAVANTLVTHSAEAGILRDYGPDDLTASHSGFWNPAATGGSFSGTANVTGTNGNVSSDPRYRDRARGDYRLGFLSPAIDAADGAAAPALDRMGASRYTDPRSPHTGTPSANGSYPDMGAFEFVETAPSDLDLVVSLVTGPSAAVAGSSAELRWTVTNVGSGYAAGPWHDTVYLVRTPDTAPVELPAGEALVGSGVILGPGESVTASASVRVPGSTLGAHRWGVRANSRGELFEGDNGANNTTYSLDAVALDLPALAVDGSSPATGQFGAVGQQHWFQLTPGGGEQVVIRLGLTSGTGTTGMLVGQGYLPDPQHYDFAQTEWSSASTTLVIPGTSTQTYYLVVYAQSLDTAAADFAVSADVPGFAVTSVEPSSAGNRGPATFAVAGGGFGSETTFRLVGADGAGSYEPVRLFYVNPSLVYATFNLTGLPPGSYGIRATGDGGPATLADAVTVTAASAGQLEYGVEVPQAVRPGRAGTVTVRFKNTGATDVTAPLLWLTADGASFRPQAAVCPGCSPAFPPAAESGYILGINRNGPAGLLPPGATGSVVLEMTPLVSSGALSFTLHTVTDPDLPVDWPSLKESLRPYYVSAEAWEPVFANFLTRVGSTIGQYNAALAENATTLSRIGDYTEDASSLLYYILGQCGLGDISSRHLLGAFGRGRPLVYDLWGELRDGQPVLHYPNGKPREFFPTGAAAGEHTGVPGDYARLQVNGADGSWDLTEPDAGVRTHLLVDPSGSTRLLPAYSEDRNGNRVTLAYTDGRVTAVTDANGDTTTFAYDGNGRVTRLTDPVGRTTDYAYDASGEHLASVTTSRGTTRYAYVTGAGAAREHALASATYPDGSQRLYEYDAQGRLLRTAKAGGAEPLAYSYDDTGGVTLTDALGRSRRFFFNRYSQAGRTVDPLGHAVEYGYDENHQLASVTGEEGVRSTIRYDERGNRTGVTTPLGAHFSASFGAYRRLSRLVDGRGSLTELDRDERGNLLGITYPDGSRALYEPDAQGRTARAVNRRGQAVAYTYDARGRTVRKEVDAGAAVEYSYDGRGRLASATDGRGATSFTYDDADRLTRVDSPGGKHVAYTYDGAGRRAGVTTQDGFSVAYEYDAVGRLAAVRDGAGSAVALYTYDAAGQLARKDLGNGAYTSFAYDAAGHPTQVLHRAPGGALVSRFDYTYDRQGLISTMTTLEGRWDYRYDAAGQLVEVTTPAGRVLRYAYDLSGNRETVTDAGVETAYWANAADQYTAAGGSTFAYDADGNLSSRVTPAGTWAYAYDAENRLVGVTGPSTAETYEYDALGNRAAAVRNGVRTQYLYDLVDLVGEYDGSGGLVAHYAHGRGLVGRVNAAGAPFYYHFDASGGTAQVTDAAGAVRNAYSYLPYGERLSADEGVPNPFTFAGELGVVDDRSTGLHFMRHRYYDAALGRFTQPDPLGLASGETNLYRYAGNLPHMNADPSGLVFGGMFNTSSAPAGGAQSRGGALEAVNQAAGGNAQQAAATQANVLQLTNPNNPFGKLPQHYLQQGNQGAAYAAAAALVVSMYTGQSHFAEHFSHFSEAWTHYNTVFSDHQPGDVNDPQVVDAVNALNEDFQNYLNEQCHNPPPPPSGPCNKPASNRLAPRAPAGAAVCAPMPPAGGGSTTVVTSYDPNVKITVGYGEEGYVAQDAPVTYTVYFENKDTALAPAQKVVVTDALSASLDPSTLKLLRIGFNNQVVDPPEGAQEYSGSASVTTDAYPVRVEASLDRTSGVVTWTLASVDPLTGETPADPFAGFLPPNDGSHRGEGFVAFSIRPRAGLANGAAVANSATIVFDENAPIVTNVVTNTLDTAGPDSSVGALPSSSSGPDVTVRWAGTDPGGSGVALFDVYSAADGGAFALWLASTDQTSAVFTGTPGHSYGFLSVATDNVGHRQTYAATAQATTLIAAPVDGACGGADGTAVTAKPAADLCEDGSLPEVTGSGPWAWECAGADGGAAAPCSASLATEPPTFTVTPGAAEHVAVDPSTPRTVAPGGTVSFTVTAEAGYGAVAGGCGGALAGSTFTTGPVTGNCTISVSGVKRSGSANGTPPTAADAESAVRAVYGLVTLSPEERVRYDVAPLGPGGVPVGDGLVDMADVIAILRRSLGIGAW